jgi:hypothetical protein
VGRADRVIYRIDEAGRVVHVVASITVPASIEGG